MTASINRWSARMDCNTDGCPAHLKVDVEDDANPRDTLTDRARSRGWDVGARFRGIPTNDHCPRHNRRAN